MKNSIICLMVAFSIAAHAQNGLSFDGTNDYVQTDYSGVSGAGARTIEAWIKTSANCDPNNGGTQKVIADWGTFVNGQRFTFNILWADAIRIEVGGNGLSGSIAVNDGKWHHVACAYDPNASSNFSLYVDGVLDAAGNLTVSTNTGNGVKFRIGKRIDNVNLFDGEIDEVRVWNVARTITELANNRNAEFCSLPANLEAYFTFNQGKASGSNNKETTLLEYVNGNDGTLNSFSLSGGSSNWVTGANLTPGMSLKKTTKKVCDSLVSPSGIFVWLKSGTYQDTVSRANVSCDSVLEIKLTVGKTTDTSYFEASCGPYTSPGGKLWTTSGLHLDTIQNASGCPEYLAINLNVVIIDSNVVKTGSKLTASETGASSYQWLRCDSVPSVISGATGNSIEVVENGSYAVAMKKDGCADTSICYNISAVGFADNALTSKFKVYPNPTAQNVTIELNEDLAAELTLTNMQGSIVEQWHIENTKMMILEMPKEKGVYFLKIISGSGIATTRIIKN